MKATLNFLDFIKLILYKINCEHKLEYLIGCSLLVLNVSIAQSLPEKGNPQVINYSNKEYGADLVNWAIAQDDRGIMYFGNIGLLEFDGANWKVYHVSNKSVIRSIAIGSDKKIYVGGVGDLGYFEPNDTGKLKFHSLMEFIPKENRNFSDVWNTFFSNGTVYFNTSNYVFTWNIAKKEITVISDENPYHAMFLIDGEVFVREWGKGLCVLKNSSFSLLPGGEKFAEERVYVMLPFPDEKGSYLIGTRTMGMFKFDGTNFTPFKTEVDDFITENVIYMPGQVLSDGNMLLATLNGGVVIIDKNGKELEKYDTENGLLNNNVYYTFQDHSGAIWVATDNGISRIDYDSPMSFFDKRNNLSSLTSDIIRHDGMLYLAANNGAFYLDPQTRTFERIGNSNIQTFSFLKWDDELFMGSFGGLFKIENKHAIPIKQTVGNELNIQVLIRSKVNPNRIYIGAEGLWSLLKKGNEWIDEGQLLDIQDAITSIKETSDGKLWVGTNAYGVYKITPPTNTEDKISKDGITVEKFDDLGTSATFIYKINGTEYFTTFDSIYKFDKTKKIFYHDPNDPVYRAFQPISDNDAFAIYFNEDRFGRLWVAEKGKIAMGTLNPDSSYSWISNPFNSIASGTIAKIYSEESGVIWFSSDNSLIKYDASEESMKKEAKYNAMVRQVSTGKDSIIYSGGKTLDLNTVQIPFKNNAFKFNYSATSFEGKNTNKFKTILEGFDEDWSAWSTETTKEYTNLPPGNYTFKVKSLNILGTESSMDSYVFEILPPWYRTWWAYALYILLFALGIYAVDKFQRKRFHRIARERAEFSEAKLRADAENEKRKNVELISEIGKDITSSLSIEHIIETVYLHVNKLMDASVFGIGIHNKHLQILEFPFTKENGKTLPPYHYSVHDEDRFASLCFNNKNEILLQDYDTEYQKYLKSKSATVAGSSTSSVVYLPLIYKQKTVGVLTAQSFNKNAYSDFHHEILRNIATYTALELENADAYRDLQLTQNQLIQSEKMASLGELTAGIAHEIQNPLNFVNNFSEVSNELIDEINGEIQKGNLEEVKAIMTDIKSNLEKINHHGKRADAIVKGMLQHSRISSAEKEPTDINKLADEYLRLAYHGLRAKDKTFNATLETDYDHTIGQVLLIPQDMGRVILNLITNAFYAVDEKKKSGIKNYEPTVKLSTTKQKDSFKISVKDNGNGIAQNVLDKIFQPFFTTKPTGKGTGLGLSMSYDIVKAHGGDISVKTEINKGSTFSIIIPN